VRVRSDSDREPGELDKAAAKLMLANSLWPERDRVFIMHQVHYSPEGLKSHILMEGSRVTGCGRSLRCIVG
jgi:hypothetical protein